MPNYFVQEVGLLVIAVLPGRSLSGAVEGEFVQEVKGGQELSC